MDYARRNWLETCKHSKKCKNGKPSWKGVFSGDAVIEEDSEGKWIDIWVWYPGYGWCSFESNPLWKVQDDS